MAKVRFIDAFSGAGLFSGGWVQRGAQPVLAVDLDKDAVASYNANLPPVAVWGSVIDFPDIPRADILIAGPPCQGFSSLGRRNPRDERNGLALAVVDWADRSEASVVVVENVPPFLGSPQWKQLEAQFRDRGFEVFTWVLDAVHYGTPQLRRRAFTIASMVGYISQPPPLGKIATAGSALSDPISVTDPFHRWPIPKGIAAERMPIIPPLGDKRDIMRVAPHLCPPSWRKMGCQATDVWGRINPHAPLNTLRCCFQNPSKGRYLHPTENRTLSLREGARMQGVPDQWAFVGTPNSIARQIGNGVPIPLAAAVADKVIGAVLSGTQEARAA